MPDPLPPSLKRRAASTQRQLEDRLLSRFAVMRDVRLSILWPRPGDPDLDTWIIAAEGMGLTVAYAVAENVATFSKDGERQFLAFGAPGGAITAILT